MVINKVSLDVGPYARIGFLGPNGCGKSTLMNLLAGELKPIYPRRGEETPPASHRVFLPWTSSTFPSVHFNNWPEPTWTWPSPRAMGGRTLGCVLAGAAVTRPIRTLSGGQRNRVALALITFHNPHVFIWDEITNHLDMGTIESLVESLCEFEGALVVVSHDNWSSSKLLKATTTAAGEESRKRVFCIL